MRRGAWPATTFSRDAPSSPGGEPFEQQGGSLRCSAIRAKGAFLKRSAGARLLTGGCSRMRKGWWCSPSSGISPGARIERPALDVSARRHPRLQNAGPHAPACMPSPAICRSREARPAGARQGKLIACQRAHGGTAFAPSCCMSHRTGVRRTDGSCATAIASACRVKARRIDLLVDEAELKRVPQRRRRASAP